MIVPGLRRGKLDSYYKSVENSLLNQGISLLQSKDEVIAASCFCDCFHLGVCGGRSAHPDIFPYGFINQKIVLGDEGCLIVEPGKGNVFLVMSVGCDGSPAYVMQDLLFRMIAKRNIGDTNVHGIQAGCLGGVMLLLLSSPMMI